MLCSHRRIDTSFRRVMEWLGLHAGDVIGAYLNQAEQTISYTKNGIDLGVAFKNVKEKELFPTVGMRTRDEEVRNKAHFLLV